MKGNKKLFGLVIIIIFLIGLGVYFGSQNGSWLLGKISGGGKWFLPVLVAAALVDSMNPCAFSVLLLTIAFLFSLGKLRSDILKAGGFYILGIFLVYILIGLGILQSLYILNTPHFVAKIGAVILIAAGLINIINEFFPSFPIKLRIPQAAHAKMAQVMTKASLPASFGLGALVGLSEFPCTGGPYLTVLGMLHDKGSRFMGLEYLVLFNVIFVLPLVVTLLIASNRTLLEKVQAWKKEETGKARFWSGIAMVVLGIIIFAL